jgi:hypothetical protein
MAPSSGLEHLKRGDMLDEFTSGNSGDWLFCVRGLELSKWRRAKGAKKKGSQDDAQ